MIHLQPKNFLPKIIKAVAVLVCLLGHTIAGIAQNKDSLSHRVESAEQINPTTVELIFSDKQRLTIDFYGENIFRVFEDTSGNMIRKPESMPPADILVDNPRRSVGPLTIKDAVNTITIISAKIAVEINKGTALIKVVNIASQKVVLQTLKPFSFSDEKTTAILKENPEEYFFGGGVQNGRVSHKNNSIAIVNESSWTDGGVASPVPFYWSTNGYGMMWYTFKPGKYDFGSKE
ncbi:MAG: alpha-xylosidase, partial [Ferruginibacter sp.]